MSRSDNLLLGIDLGTARISVLSNTGYQDCIHSAVGYPKDIIGLTLLGKSQVFGEEALQHHSALTLYHPLEDGLFREANHYNYNTAYELLKHVITKATDAAGGGSVSGVIAVPARASLQNKKLLADLAKDLLDVSLIVSKPFMVAYQLNRLTNSIIVDIGAGTVDICAMKGMVPHLDDQVTLTKAGNYIDNRFVALVSERFPELQISKTQLHHIKEQFAFVAQYGGSVITSLRADGLPVEVDLTNELRSACESIMPDILEQLVAVVKGFDPEVQPEVLENIFISGEGSLIKGIDEVIALHLVEYGDVDVRCIDPNGFVGAQGALKLAQDLEPEVWGQVGFMHGYAHASASINNGSSES
jgi:rod shape-determining protein MreB